MGAKYIMAALAGAFLAAALMGLSRGSGMGHPQTKTWLLVGSIFALVSAWLFSQEHLFGHGPAAAGIDLESSPQIDSETPARTKSAGAAPVPLDAKSRGAAASEAGMADRIVGYARRQLKTRIGKGECTDLVDSVLRTAGAKSASDYGNLSPDADYKWGIPVTMTALQPGDVIQFRNYSYRSMVVTRTGTGTTKQERGQDRPHHTAIVESVGDEGAVTVLEQNAPDGSPVTRTVLYFKDSTTTSGQRTTTITVKGKFWFFRPQPK
jgi:hypothetical protein